MICVTEEIFHEMDDSSMGVCLACKATACGVEPDARKYQCESCDEHKVYGAAELLLMGHIRIVDDETEVNLEW